MLLFNSTIRFVPCAFFINKQFHTCAKLSRMSSLAGRVNIARVNIGFFTGFKKIKQRRISCVLCYLRMILRKMSTVISIKHRILTTFNIKKICNSDSLYAFKVKKLRCQICMMRFFSYAHCVVC